MNLAIRLGITFLVLGGTAHALLKVYAYLSRPYPDHYEDF